MSVCYISEYAHLGADGRTLWLNSPLEPPIAEQTVAIGAEAKSAAFNASTKFVRVHVDAVCSILFGTAPTATTSKKRMAANTTEYFAVPMGQSYKLSVITNT